MLIIVVTVTLVRYAAQQNPVDDTRMYQLSARINDCLSVKAGSIPVLAW